MKIYKFNTINEKYNIRDFYIIEKPGDFDLRMIDFSSFNDAMEYLTNNYDKELVDSYGTAYKIYKIKKELVDNDMFKMWQDTNNYNL